MTGNKQTRGWRTGYFMGLVAAAFMLMSVQPVTAATITDENLAEHVANAKTAADHEALAAYYNAQAAAAAAKVKSHETMLKSLKQAGGRPAAMWDTHCRKLISAYKNVEKEATAAAQEQERLATEAGK